MTIRHECTECGCEIAVHVEPPDPATADTPGIPTAVYPDCCPGCGGSLPLESIIERAEQSNEDASARREGK